MEVVVNCNVPNCDGKHNIVFIKQKAVIGMEEFFKIVNYWEKNVRKHMWEILLISKILHTTQTTI